jgi:ABC-type transport system involved in cytochrome c biogenesis permease subunit
MQRAVLRVTLLAGQGIAPLVPPLIGALDRQRTLHDMKRIRLIMLGFMVLICTIIIVVISASSLWEGNNKAQLLSLLFGSLAAGATLTNLIMDIKKKRK